MRKIEQYLQGIKDRVGGGSLKFSEKHKEFYQEPKRTGSGMYTTVIKNITYIIKRGDASGWDISTFKEPLDMFNPNEIIGNVKRLKDVSEFLLDYVLNEASP